MSDACNWILANPSLFCPPVYVTLLTLTYFLLTPSTLVENQELLKILLKAFGDSKKLDLKEA